MKHIYRLTAKAKTMRTIAFMLLSLSALSLSAQSDDVYYSPKHDSDAQAQEAAPASKHDSQNYDYYDGETYSDYNDDETYSESETMTDENGTYITNNYYGDYYESD